MPSRHRSRRRGISTGLIVVFIVLGVLMIVGITIVAQAIQAARETARQNTCRSNLSVLSGAVVQYDNRQGRYPGYMNALRTHDGNLYFDPTTKKPVPVSWVVELLQELEERPLYDRWRTPGETTHTQIHIPLLTCLSDPATDKTSRLSYVANSGMRDAPAAIPASSGSGGASAGSAGIPRDWLANGLFFDNYSDDPLVKTQQSERGPTVVMRSMQIRDPKDKTIMFTENLDATKYVYDENDFPARDPSQVEIIWGSVWNAGTIDDSSPTEAPIMTPPADVLRPNMGIEKGPHPLDYEYCRPSSAHPGGFNVAFAGRNVVFVRDRISYFIWAKLMASDDANTKIAGTQTLLPEAFRKWQIPDSDVCE